MHTAWYTFRYTYLVSYDNAKILLVVNTLLVAC